MGRLFWKFFISIWLAQVLAIVVISGAFWLKENSDAQIAGSIEQGPPAHFLLDASEATLRTGGIEALRNLLRVNPREKVYAISVGGHELLGREVNPETLKQVRTLQARNTDAAALRTLIVHGEEWLLFVGRRGPPPAASLINGVGPGGRGKGGPPRWRFMPEIFALVGSLAAAGVLAWYFAKPIRHLRSAFDDVASGKLDARVGPAVGKRRDELADLARDFDRMAERLQDLVEGQRRLLHDVSHELRSPLARLQAAVGLARQSPDKAVSSLDRIERESTRMNVMIGELLTLARLEAGVFGALNELVALDELLVAVVDDARFEANASDKDVLLDAVPARAVRGNPELLHSAIENIVRNAVRHTADGTAVEVLLWQDRPDRVRITIRDHGDGAAEEELKDIFLHFVRGHNAHRQTGHGLGLAIADRVIRAHGGAVNARNAPGGGLEVAVELPCTASL